MVFDQGACAAHEGVVGFMVHEEDHVRIAHGDGTGRVQHRRVDGPDLQLDAARIHGLVERDLGPVEAWRTHIHRDPAIGRPPRRRRPAQRVDPDLIPAARLQQHPADAAQGVAAGLDRAAVGIPHPHEGVGGG